MKRALIFVALGLPLHPGCGEDVQAGSSGGIETTGASTGVSSGGSTTGGDGSSSGGPTDEPQYPPPSPVGMTGDCPTGAFGPITFDGDGWICLPSCIDGDPPTCPQPQTGNATAECATNPLSSSDPCMDSTDCTVDGEMCGNIGGGQMGCLLPPSHCILRCGDGQTCPDGMACSDAAGICQYLP